CCYRPPDELWATGNCRAHSRLPSSSVQPVAASVGHARCESTISSGHGRTLDGSLEAQLAGIRPTADCEAITGAPARSSGMSSNCAAISRTRRRGLAHLGRHGPESSSFLSALLSLVCYRSRRRYQPLRIPLESL